MARIVRYLTANRYLLLCIVSFVPLPELPVAVSTDKVRVKAVERKAEPIKRIREREDIGTPTAGKEASLTLRPLLRAVQPHEIRSDIFGGLGAVPPDKENIVGGDNRGFATRS